MSGVASLVALAGLLLASGARAQDTASGQAPSGKVAAIASGAAVGGLALLLVLILVWRYARKRQTPRTNASSTVEMAQTSGPAVSATVTARPRRSRPRRQPSTQTVPEYTVEANEEEMVLGKAETSTIEDVDSFTGHQAPRRSDDGPLPRGSISQAGSILRDITPAPELRIERYDTVQSFGAFSLTSAENASLLLPMSRNSSVADLQENVMGAPPDSPPTTWSSRNASTASLLASPAYVNRNRSRSIDVFRPMPGNIDEAAAVELSDSDIAVQIQSSSRSRTPSGIRMMFPRRTSQISQSPQLPPARREALRNRDISAPLADTLVRTSTSYVYPKAGLNPLQAAWLGSRESINRLTMTTTPVPPDFGTDEDIIHEETSEQVQAEGDQEVGGSAPLRIDTSMAQLAAESAQLSALVSRASMHRASVPPHLVALPPSLPTSPLSPAFSVSQTGDLRTRKDSQRSIATFRTARSNV